MVKYVDLRRILSLLVYTQIREAYSSVSLGYVNLRERIKIKHMLMRNLKQEYKSIMFQTIVISWMAMFNKESHFTIVAKQLSLLNTANVTTNILSSE